MKRYLAIILMALAMFCLTACGQDAADGQGGTDGGKLQIVTTTFPEYDWARNVLGDTEGAEITLLLDEGVDMHSYQPTARDIVKISTCDLLIYGGGESDAWVQDALVEGADPDMVVISLLETIGDSAKAEETVEGMEAEDEEGEDGSEYDEHVWLSLRNAAVLTGAIADSLARLDPDHAQAYRDNADAYNRELNALDEEYRAAVSGAKVRTLLFGDRFPFRYLTDDYGLDYYAAFAGCSAETEASFETIVFLAHKVDELGLKAILTIETGDQKIAETIRENTSSKDQQILVMDSMQSASSEEAERGVTYLSIMEQNLEVLKKALQ